MINLEKWTIVHYSCQKEINLSIRQRAEFFAKTMNQAKKKDRNRQTLIDATLDCIAEIGLIQTSVSEIISRAGLSRGMIHLHFGGKDQLVVEAARHASEAYYRVLDENISGTQGDPKRRVEAIIRSDLSEGALNQRDASIWHEFRGAARTKPDIARYSDTRDLRLHQLLYSAILEICGKENIDDPENAARDYTVGLIAMTEGLWTDFLLHPEEFDRKNAERVVFRFLSGIWPATWNGDAE